MSEWPLLIYSFNKKYTLLFHKKAERIEHNKLRLATCYILLLYFGVLLQFQALLFMLGRFLSLRSDSWHYIYASFHLLVPCFSQSAFPKAALVQFMCLCITGWSTKKTSDSLVLLVPRGILDFTLKLVPSIQWISLDFSISHEQCEQQKGH